MNYIDLDKLRKVELVGNMYSLSLAIEVLSKVTNLSAEQWKDLLRRESTKKLQKLTLQQVNEIVRGMDERKIPSTGSKTVSNDCTFID